ncbi:ferrous iron transport protein A [candidate division KSB1 bacterium]|nr:ferrous iron transport protein A [candidate division KSB1 bacterium]
MTLNDIAEKQKFKIIRVIATGEIRTRLVDMGFIGGMQGKVLRKALLNDPIELQLKGYKVSLRRSEARQILVENIS